MKKHCKNLKVGLQITISWVIMLFILIPLCIIYPQNFILPGSTIALSIIFLTFGLFVEPIGLLFLVQFDKYGIKLYFCKKLKKSYKWTEVEKIEVCNPYRSGKYFRICLNNKTFLYISKTKKIEQYFKNID